MWMVMSAKRHGGYDEKTSRIHPRPMLGRTLRTRSPRPLPNPIRVVVLLTLSSLSVVVIVAASLHFDQRNRPPSVPSSSWQLSGGGLRLPSFHLCPRHHARLQRSTRGCSHLKRTTTMTMTQASSSIGVGGRGRRRHGCISRRTPSHSSQNVFNPVTTAASLVIVICPSIVVTSMAPRDMSTTTTHRDDFCGSLNDDDDDSPVTPTTSVFSITDPVIVPSSSVIVDELPLPKRATHIRRNETSRKRREYNAHGVSSVCRPSPSSWSSWSLCPYSPSSVMRNVGITIIARPSIMPDPTVVVVRLWMMPSARRRRGCTHQWGRYGACNPAPHVKKCSNRCIFDVYMAGLSQDQHHMVLFHHIFGIVHPSLEGHWLHLAGQTVEALVLSH
jgi:hypothetical protein